MAAPGLCVAIPADEAGRGDGAGEAGKIPPSGLPRVIKRKPPGYIHFLSANKEHNEEQKTSRPQVFYP
jgi:hypothetical protein